MEGAIESCGNNSQSSSQKRRSFTNKQKAQAVKRSEVIGVNGAAKEFSIDRRLMQRWRAMPSDDARVSRRAKTTRRGKFEKMEEELGVWFTDCRTLSKCVRTKDIKRKAIELHKKFDYVEPFTASNGWLEGFKTRYNIASRKITGHSQKIPTSFPTLATAFWAEFRYIVQQSDVKPPNIINMDETPCYFDMGGGSTFSTKGERDILQRTTGHDKTRFTCCLSVTGSGRALPTMLIFKNLVKVPQLPAGKTWPKDIVVTVAKGGSMTSELFQYYLDNIVSRRPGALFGSKCVVVVDSATSHKGQPKDHNIEIIKIPKGCTPLLQPLDVYVNKPFKSILGEKWQKWIDQPEAVHELTRGGNRKRASYLDIASWVSSAVRELDPHMIENSFVGCGLVGHDGGDQWSNVVNRARLHTRIKPYLEEPSEVGLVDSSDDEEVVNDEDDGLLESDVEIVEPVVVDVESKYAVNTLVTSDEQVLFDLDDDLSTVEITIKETTEGGPSTPVVYV